jgi:hypothetical protein
MIASNYTQVYVWPAPTGNKIWGFYSLSPYIVERDGMVKPHKNKTPPTIPAPCALIGFMGKSQHAPPKFGPVLIHDAALRASRSDMAFWGMCLHAENDALARWYGEKIGLTAAVETPRLMYAPFSALLDPKKSNLLAAAD